MKGYYLNVIVGICEEMMKWVEFVKEIGIFIIMYDFFIGGFIVNIIFVCWCWDNGILFYIYWVMYVVVDCQKNYGIYFWVLVKCLCLFGGDYFYFGIVVGKLEGEWGIIMGFVDFMCEDYVEEDCFWGIFFI